MNRQPIPEYEGYRCAECGYISKHRADAVACCPNLSESPNSSALTRNRSLPTAIQEITQPEKPL